MDDLEVDEILAGLGNQSFIDQRLHLLELLTNKLAEETQIDDSKLRSVFEILLTIPIVTSSSTEDGKRIINTSISALCNATVSEPAAMLLLDCIEPEDSKLNKQFHFIIKKYLQYNPQAEVEETESELIDWTLADEWQYVGSVLCNICQVEKGRKIILKTSTGYIERIAAQVSIIILLSCSRM